MEAMAMGGGGVGGGFFFFLSRSSLLTAVATAAGRGNKKMLKSFLPAVLLSASVERFFVSHKRDFFWGCLALFCLRKTF